MGRRSAASLREQGAYVELDDRGESVGRKIRDAELRKVPYMLIVGEREAGEGSVSVREHGGAEEERQTAEFSDAWQARSSAKAQKMGVDVGGEP